jgi:hypothetical protein
MGEQQALACDQPQQGSCRFSGMFLIATGGFTQVKPFFEKFVLQGAGLVEYHD